MKLRALSVLLLSAVSLALSGCIAGLTYTAGNGHTPTIYIDTSFSNSPSILGFTAGSTSTTPASTITIANTITPLKGMAIDAAGNIYTTMAPATNTLGVDVFAPSATGAATPTRSFTFTSTSPVSAFTADLLGNTYIINSSGAINEFGPTASGTSPTPVVSTTGFTSIVAIRTDINNVLYTVNSAGVVNVYANGINTDPTRTITPSFTNSTQTAGIAIDVSGNIYVSGFGNASGVNTGQIVVYSSTASGTSTPTRVIAGSSTGIVGTGGVAVDLAGNIYMRDNSIAPAAIGGFSPLSGGFTVLLQFAAGANGNVAPTNTVATGLFQSGDYGIAVY